MARNVGSIEVTVDANTGRLTAQMRVAGSEGGRSYKSAFEDQLGDISGREMLARLKLIRAKAEADLRNIELQIGFDDGEARAGLRRLQARIEATQLEIDIDPNFNNAALAADLQAIREIIRDVRLDVKTDVDPADVLFIKGEIDRLLGEVEVEIVPDIKTSKFAGAKAKMDAFSKNLGKSGGSGFMSGLTHSLQDGGQIAVAAILSMGPGIAQGLEGLLAAGTAVISSAFSAIAGGGLAAAAAVAAFGGAAAASVVGSRNFFAALRDINSEFATAREEGRDARIFTGEVGEALGKLAPNARDAAIAFAGINTALHDSQIDVQNTLFEDLDTTIARFGKTTLPSVTGALDIAAASVNTFVKNLAAAAEETDFTGTMEALKPALDNALTAAVSFIDTISPFLKTAGGVGGPADRLTGFIADMAEEFNRFVRANPGKIKTFLDEGVTSLELWVGLIGTVGSTLGTIFGSGKGPGNMFVSELDLLIEKFNGFLKSPEGQTSLANFFGEGQQAILDLQPAVKGLREAWDILTGADGGTSFAQVMEDIGTALPGVSKILVQISDLRLGTGIATTIQVLGDLLEIFGLLPDPVQQFAGQLIVVSKLLGPLNSLLFNMAKAGGAAAKGFGWLAALNLAVTAGLFLWEHFSDKTDEAAARTDAVSAALDGAIHSLEGTNEQLSAADAATQVWNDALANSGDVSNELRSAFSSLGLTMDDAFDIATRFNKGGQETAAVMEDMREEAGFTDDAFRGIGGGISMLQSAGASLNEIQDKMWERFHTTAEAANMSRASFDENIESLFNLQDAATGLDMNAIAEQSLRNAASLDDQHLAALEAAAANIGLSGSIDDILDRGVRLPELMDAYAAELAGVSTETNTANAAVDAQTAGMVALSGAYTNAGIAAQERAAALKIEQHEALVAFQAEQDLAQATRDTAAAVATTQFNLPEGVAQGFVDLGEAIDRTSAAADALSSSMDALFGAFPDFQEAQSNTEESLDALRDQLNGVTTAADGSQEKIEGWQATLALGDQAGRDNAAAIRESVAAMNEQAVAATQAGESAESTTAIWNAQHQQIVDTVAALYQQQAANEGVELSLADATARAETYVDALSGTPDAVTTVINMPGLVDALLNAEDLTVLYDDMGNPVVTEFEALGIDPAIADSEFFLDLLEQLGGTEAVPTVGVNDPDDIAMQIQNAQQGVDTLGETTADPTLALSTQVTMMVLLAAVATELKFINDFVANPKLRLTDYSLVTTQMFALSLGLAALDSKVAAPDVRLNGYQTVMQQIDNIQVNMSQIHDKTVTIRVNQVGSTSVPGAMAGELIGGPGLRRVGEFGMAEAIVPLELPLSRVDPSVRWMAEMIRGGSGGGRGGMTLNQTIVTQTEDTVSVAAQVVNRMSAAVAGL